MSILMIVLLGIWEVVKEFMTCSIRLLKCRYLGIELYYVLRTGDGATSPQTFQILLSYFTQLFPVTR